MIIQKEIKIGEKTFTQTYSDMGYFIERDGIKYIEAVDPPLLGREYVETTELIKSDINLLNKNFD